MTGDEESTPSDPSSTSANGSGDNPDSDNFGAEPYSNEAYEVKTSVVEKELHAGPKKRIVGVVADGRCEAFDFLKNLSSRDQVQFAARFERYCELGYLKSPDEKRRLVEAGVTVHVHEIKTRNGHRLFGIEERDRFVATHGAKKPKKNKVTAHADRARSAYKRMQSEGEAER